MGCVSATDQKKGQLPQYKAPATTENKNISAPPDLSKTEAYHNGYAASNEEAHLLHGSEGKPFTIEPKPAIDPSHEHEGIKQTASKYLDKENVQESLIHTDQVIGDLPHQKSPEKIEEVIRGANSNESPARHVSSDLRQGSNSFNIELNLHSRDFSKELEQEPEQKEANYKSGIKEADKHLEHSNTEHKSPVIRNIEGHVDLNQSNSRSAIQVSRGGSQNKQTNIIDQPLSGEPQVEEMLHEQYPEQANFFFPLPEIKLVF